MPHALTKLTISNYFSKHSANIAYFEEKDFGGRTHNF
jgi:hypothetical protein